LGVETRYGLLSSNEKLRLIREERPKSIIDWASQLGRCGDQLPFLFSEASAEFRDKVQAVEDRADDCYQLLRLLKRPRNLAAWALLTRMALGLERTLQEYGANSPRHRMAVINLDLCTCGFKFIAVHCKPESRLAEKYTWHGSIAQDAGDALDLCIKYNHFLNVFPMWHKNHEQVDLLPEGQVRFHIPRDSPRQRQAIAYKHIFRPSEEEYRPWGSVRTSESPDATRLLGELVHQVRPAGLPGKFGSARESGRCFVLRGF
jgi:hypothetical protein